jgi:hypothetical protein
MKRITAITQKPAVVRMLAIARALFFVLGVITTVSTSQLFKSCNSPAVVKERIPALTTTAVGKELKVQQQTIAAYGRRIAELNTKNVFLQQQITDSKATLAQVRQASRKTQQQLQQEIEHNAVLTDTAERLANCDSLARTANELVASCKEKDSLCNDLTNTLTAQVGLKDSTIALQEHQYSYLQLGYDRSLAQQELLFSENFVLQKQLSRHKARSKLLRAGLLLLGGAVTYMAISR